MVKKILHNIKWFFIYVFSKKARQEKTERQVDDFLGSMMEAVREFEARQASRMKELEEKFAKNAVELPAGSVEEILRLQDDLQSSQTNTARFRYISFLRKLVPALPVGVPIKLEVVPGGTSTISWISKEDETSELNEESVPEQN